MKLNEILKLKDISPKDVAIILSRPRNDKFRRGLLEDLIESNALNITFASHQTDPATKTLARRKFGMLFVPVGRGQYLMTGFYRVLGCTEKSAEYFDQDKNFVHLKEYSGFDIGSMCRENGKPTQVVELESYDILSEYVGRVIIAPQKKQGEMAYMRLAETLDPSVIAIRESGWNPSPAPNWNNFIVSASEVRSLPRAWRERLREWRGVYLIVDESKGDRYIGSAYGEFGFLNRWEAHLNGKDIEGRERGITVKLRKWTPTNFRFSILHVFAPDASDKEIIQVENNWMDRMHTRVYGLNHGT